MEDESRRGRVGETESLRENPRNNINSKELKMLLNSALNGLYHMRSYF
jgi:hypothetical protein